MSEEEIKAHYSISYSIKNEEPGFSYLTLESTVPIKLYNLKAFLIDKGESYDLIEVGTGKIFKEDYPLNPNIIKETFFNTSYSEIEKLKIITQCAEDIYTTLINLSC